MDKHPPEGPLPSLPRHVACALRRARLERRHLGGPALSSSKRREEGDKRRPGHGQGGRGGRFGGIHWDPQVTRGFKFQYTMEWSDLEDWGSPIYF